MLLRRREGKPRPWTDDPVLSSWRFCNVFREDDRTTVWFRENIRSPLTNSDDVILATVAFRWFNRIETGEVIKDILLSGDWNSSVVRKRLYLKEPVVTGAYMIKTPAGMDKLNGVLWCIDNVAKDIKNILKFFRDQTRTLQESHAMFRRYPFFGPFMAYEVVTDLRHAWPCFSAPDVMTWANPGPGCTRGLGRIVAGDPSHFSESSASDVVEMNSVMSELLEMSQSSENWPSSFPRWEMREVEHGCCEFDKYSRGQMGEKLKRRY